jgi:hypothetical protein
MRRQQQQQHQHQQGGEDEEQIFDTDNVNNMNKNKDSNNSYKDKGNNSSSSTDNVSFIISRSDDHICSIYDCTTTANIHLQPSLLSLSLLHHCTWNGFIAS